MGEVVQLGLEEYLALLQKVKEIDERAKDGGRGADGVVVHAADVMATNEPSCVHVTASFDIELLGTGWVDVPLLHTCLSVLECSVVRQQQTGAVEATAAGVCAIRHSKHVAVLHDQGRYRVTIVAIAPYANDRRNSFGLDLPLCSTGQLTMRVTDGRRLQIMCTPSLTSRLTADGAATVLVASFAPTSRITVQWTEVVATAVPMTEEAAEGEAAAASEPAGTKGVELVTVQQETSYAVGEGVMVLSASFAATLVHTSRAVFEVAVPEGATVLQVDGDYIGKWRVVDSTDMLPEASSSTDVGGVRWRAPQPLNTLVIELTRAQIDEYSFTVVLEVGLAASVSAIQVSLPILYLHNVTREKALYNIEARTNVEVSEVRCEGVAPIDVSELPAGLLSAQSQSLLAYKSLQPSSAVIVLSVTKHQDTSVLVCAVDVAKVDATVSAEGKILHRLQMNVRNTQQQYMRATLPPNHTIWSTVVSSKPIKPATDRDGRLMIPLTKSKGTATQNAFTVEVVYLVPIPEMGSSGVLTVELPRIDVPINILDVSVWIPKGYSFKDFGGSFSRSVPYFSQEYYSTAAPVDQDEMLRFSQAQVSQLSNVAMNISHELKYQSAMLDDMDTSNSVRSMGFSRKGVVPVKVEAPTVGQPHLFERLLVINEQLNILGHYHKLSKNKCFC